MTVHARAAPPARTADEAAVPAPRGVRRRAWPFFAAAGAGLAVLLALLVHVSGEEVVALFKVTAESERVELTLAADGTDPIRLHGAGVEDDLRARPGVTGELRLADGVHVVVTRMADEALLTLVAEPPEGGRVVGTLRPDGGAPVELTGAVAVTLPLTAAGPAGRRTDLHFAARDVRIGAVWRPGGAGSPRPLLRSGRVSLMGLAQGNVPFEAQSFELGPYEMITGYPGRRPRDPQPLWWATITAGTGPALQGSFAVMDTRIALWRGTETYALGVTAFDHLRGHPRLALICAVLVLLAQIAAALLTHALERALDRRAILVESWRP